MFNRISASIWQSIIRVWAFLSKETRTILHQPRLVFSLILGPFLILLIFGLGYRNTPRTLNTLFVVPEGSKIEELVETYANSLGDRIVFAGLTHDAAEADRRLKSREVDLVVVTPLDPEGDWKNDEQAIFSLYHSEVDPFEDVYIQVIGQRYVEEINQQLLMAALQESQHEAETWQEEIALVQAEAAKVRQALSEGDKVAAQASAGALKQEFNFLKLAVGSGIAMVAGLENATDRPEVTTTLLHEMEQLESQIDEVVLLSEDVSAFAEGEARAAELEASLSEIDGLLLTFREMDTAVLVAPFRSEALSVTQVRIEPMHFYVPAVIALLLQHLAVTLAGLSIIREKVGGAMELFRAAPLSAFEMLLGKYSSYLLLIGVMAAALTALIIFVLGMPQLGTWAGYILILVALLLASLGMGFHISLSARSDSQAIQYGMLTLLAAIFFSGLFLPLYRLAPAVRIVSWLLPATYGTVLLQDNMLRGQPPQLLLMVALLGFAGILFLLGWFRLARQMVRE